MSTQDLGALVQAWSARGQLLPVPVIAAMFDDLLAADVDPFGRSELDLADIQLNAEGRASLDFAVAPAAFGAALGAALTGAGAAAEVPHRARFILARLESGDPADAPSSPTQLRAWVRGALGQPASAAELRAVLQDRDLLPVPELASIAAGDPSELDTLLPHSSEAAEPEEVGATFIDGPVPIPSEVHSAAPGDPRARPVVRHSSSINEPRVSLAVAPAARRTAAPTHRLDPLHGDDRSWWPWVLVAVLAGAAGYLLLFW